MAAPVVHGSGRITAAIVAAPAAAFLASLALLRVLPLAGDARLFAFATICLPAIAAAPCLALLARSGSRAWLGAAAVAAPCAALLVLS